MFHFQKEPKAYHKALNKYRNHIGNIQLWIDLKKARALFQKITYEVKRLSWINLIFEITASTCTNALWPKLE